MGRDGAFSAGEDGAAERFGEQSYARVAAMACYGMRVLARGGSGTGWREARRGGAALAGGGGHGPTLWDYNNDETVGFVLARNGPSDAWCDHGSAAGHRR